METSNKEGTCLNCDSLVQEDFLYCAKCSQRLRTSKISVGSLMSELVASMFNFDSRFFQSSFKMLKPGDLTKLYIAGKRKRYLNPARLFLFAMLFHFGVLAYITKDVEMEIGTEDLTSEVKKNQTQKAMLLRYDSIVNEIEIDTTPLLDTLRNRLFYMVSYDTNIDSFSFDDDITISGGGNLLKRRYHYDDIFNMNEEDFLSHYKIKGFMQRIIARQGLRLYRNPSAMYSYFLGNLIWAVVLSLLFLSFVMKMIYWRGKRFYVEHFILLMHIHSFIFILVGLALIIDKLTNNSIGVWLWSSVVISAGYFFLSIYRYYGQGIVKSFFKYLFILFSYFFIITIFVMVILLISMLVF